MRAIPFKVKFVFMAGLLLFAGPMLKAEPSATTTPRSPDPLAEALPILQAKYADFQALQFKEGDKLGDLMARSNGKIYLCEPEPTPTPIITAFLPGNIIYWRLSSFTPETSWADLSAQFDQWTGQGAEGIILDLRSNTAPDDYAGAARLADFFTPNQTTLFSFMPGSGAANSEQVFRNDAPGPVFHLPVVIMTNRQTDGAAEALAACLKVQGALVVGRTTRGRAADFAEQKLSTGQVLRFAVAQVRMADGTDLWKHPVNPDISLVVNDQIEKAALDLIGQHGVLEVIRETAERHRMSEAALVQGKDPEWDAYLASREKKPETNHSTAPSVQDVVLINALDSLKAIQVSQRHTTTPSDGGAAPEASASVQ